MKQALLFLLCAALVVGTVGVIVAQTDTNSANSPSTYGSTSTTVSGKVISSSNNSLIVKTDDGRQMTFSLGSGVNVANVKMGDRITVDYRNLDNGQYEVSKVTPSTSNTVENTYPPSGSDTNRDLRNTPNSDTRSNYGTSGSGSDTLNSGTYRGATKSTTRDTTSGSVSDSSNSPTYNDNNSVSNRKEHHTMPRTASLLPLIALVGVALVSSGLVLRAVSRSMS